MDKKYWITIVIFVAVMIMLLNSLGKTFNEFQEYDSLIKERIGSKCYYNGDSLLIIDYSLMNETYTLSNGSVVNINLVK